MISHAFKLEGTPLEKLRKIEDVFKENPIYNNLVIDYEHWFDVYFLLTPLFHGIHKVKVHTTQSDMPFAIFICDGEES